MSYEYCLPVPYEDIESVVFTKIIDDNLYGSLYGVTYVLFEP